MFLEIGLYCYEPPSPFTASQCFWYVVLFFFKFLSLFFSSCFSSLLSVCFLYFFFFLKILFVYFLAQVFFSYVQFINNSAQLIVYFCFYLYNFFLVLRISISLLILPICSFFFLKKKKNTGM